MFETPRKLSKEEKQRLPKKVVLAILILMSIGGFLTVDKKIVGPGDGSIAPHVLLESLMDDSLLDDGEGILTDESELVQPPRHFDHEKTLEAPILEDLKDSEQNTIDEAQERPNEYSARLMEPDLDVEAELNVESGLDPNLDRESAPDPEVEISPEVEPEIDPDTEEITDDDERERIAERAALEASLVAEYNLLYEAVQWNMDEDQTLAEYFHNRRNSLVSERLRADDSYQRFLTLETLASISNFDLPDRYYSQEGRSSFESRQTQLQALIEQLGYEDGVNSETELREVAFLLTMYTEFGIFTQNFSVIENADGSLSPSSGEHLPEVLFIAQIHYINITENGASDPGFEELLEGAAYYEGLKKLNPNSSTVTDTAYSGNIRRISAQANQSTTESLLTLFSKRISVSGNEFVPNGFFTYNEESLPFNLNDIPDNVMIVDEQNSQYFVMYSNGANSGTVSDLLLNLQDEFSTPESIIARRANAAALEVENDSEGSPATYEASLAQTLMNLDFAKLLEIVDSSEFAENVQAELDILKSDARLNWQDFSSGSAMIALKVALQSSGLDVVGLVRDGNVDRTLGDPRQELVSGYGAVRESFIASRQSANLRAVVSPSTPRIFGSAMGALEGYGIVPDGYRIGNDTFGAENAIYTITVFSDGVTFSQGETHIAFNNDGTVTVERGQTANNGRSGTTYLVPRVMSR